MDLKQVRELINFISQSDFSHFEMEKEGFRLKLIRGTAAELQAVTPPQVAESAAATVMQVPSATVPTTAADEPLHDVKSPIVGTFYRASNPKADPFVETGSQVKRGQVLCIVEAMKLMNEIESDVDGEIVEILVANGQPVEYGEILFRLRPVAA